jgi:hypothetical protein
MKARKLVDASMLSLVGQLESSTQELQSVCKDAYSFVNYDGSAPNLAPESLDISGLKDTLLQMKRIRLDFLQALEMCFYYLENTCPQNKLYKDQITQTITRSMKSTITYHKNTAIMIKLYLDKIQGRTTWTM